MCTSWWTGSLTWAPSAQLVLFCRSPQGLTPKKDNTTRITITCLLLGCEQALLTISGVDLACAWSPSAKQRRNPFLGPHLRTSIWVRAIIGLLKKPFTIFCQAELKEIQNAFPVIHLVRSGPIRIKENSKRISGNSFSPLGPQNKYIGAASQTLLTGLKWRRDAG